MVPFVEMSVDGVEGVRIVSRMIVTNLTNFK